MNSYFLVKLQSQGGTDWCMDVFDKVIVLIFGATSFSQTKISQKRLNEVSPNTIFLYFYFPNVFLQFIV